MLNVTGSGIARNVKTGTDEAGNWYKRFSLEDERGNLFLCKVINRTLFAEAIENNSIVYIEKGTLSYWVNGDKRGVYVEVEEIHIIESVYAQKTAEICSGLADKMKMNK